MNLKESFVCCKKLRKERTGCISELPKTFWPYAVMYSTRIRNVCFNNRTQCTPYQSLTGKLPDMNLIHKFGATCFAYVQKAKKLEEKAQKGVFLGYDKSSPSFLVYLPGQTIIKTRNVKFRHFLSNITILLFLIFMF